MIDRWLATSPSIEAPPFSLITVSVCPYHTHAHTRIHAHTQ